MKKPVAPVKPMQRPKQELKVSNEEREHATTSTPQQTGAVGNTPPKALTSKLELSGTTTDDTTTDDTTTDDTTTDDRTTSTVDTFY